jgi:hypothetical protein
MAAHHADGVVPLRIREKGGSEQTHYLIWLDAENLRCRVIGSKNARVDGLMDIGNGASSNRSRNCSSLMGQPFIGLAKLRPSFVARVHADDLLRYSRSSI